MTIIDTVYMLILLIGSIFTGILLYYAFNGDKLAQIICLITVTFAFADSMWAHRDRGFIYNSLKGFFR